MNPQPQAPGETRRPASAWQVGGQPAHFDPLLECLVELSRIHGVPWTRESLVAGLPLENNLLTPSLLPRAAARAGLSARVVRRRIADLPYVRSGRNPENIAPDVREEHWIGTPGLYRKIREAAPNGSFIYAGIFAGILKDDLLARDIDRVGRFDAILFDEAGIEM